jgi:hypothetical protein
MKTRQELLNIIQNARDVLSSPMNFPTYGQYKNFHTSEMKTRSLWSEWQKEAEKELADLDRK